MKVESGILMSESIFGHCLIQLGRWSIPIAAPLQRVLESLMEPLLWVKVFIAKKKVIPGRVRSSRPAVASTRWKEIRDQRSDYKR